MKKIISTIIVIFLVHITLTAQCDVGNKELIRKYCKGIYLKHKVLSNKKNKNTKMVLNGGITYAIYLLNPNNSIPDLELKSEFAKPFKSYEKKTHQEDNYTEYIFTVNKSGTFKVSLDFATKEKSCILFVICFIKKDTKDK